jgi:hypothetical protein
MDVATCEEEEAIPILEARDHMKPKYHSMGSFNHKPSQGLDVEKSRVLIESLSFQLKELLCLDN